MNTSACLGSCSLFTPGLLTFLVLTGCGSASPTDIGSNAPNGAGNSASAGASTFAAGGSSASDKGGSGGTGGASAAANPGAGGAGGPAAGAGGSGEGGVGAAGATAGTGGALAAGGAGGAAAGGAGGSGGAAVYPRQIAPLSTSTVTTQTPTLHWDRGTATSVHLTLWPTDKPDAMILDQDVTGTSIQAPALASGSYSWAISVGSGASGGSGGASSNNPVSPRWEFFVGHKTSPVDSSYGSVYDTAGNGFPDLVVGAPGVAVPNVSNSPAVVGAVFLFPGVLPSNVKTFSPLSSLIDPGNDPSDYFGASVASAGAIGGGQSPALLVGAPGNLTPGKVYVYLDPSGPAIALDDPAMNPQDGFGTSVAGLGDVNGDGYADFLVGGEESSFVYLYLGNSAFTLTPVALPGAPVIRGAQGLAGVGDVNGDGFADALVGTSLYLGGPSGLGGGPVVLPAPPGASGFGGTVAAAGDVNGDGYADLLVGSTSNMAFVFLGSASGVQATPVTLSGITLGRAISGAGDVNGDGYGDVILGAIGPYQAYLFLGGPGGPSGAPTILGGGTNFGASVSGAGDVNRDGFADVLVGQRGGDAYLFLGGPDPAALQSSAMTIGAPPNSGYFGACGL